MGGAGTPRGRGERGRRGWRQKQTIADDGKQLIKEREQYDTIIGPLIHDK